MKAPALHLVGKVYYGGCAAACGQKGRPVLTGFRGLVTCRKCLGIVERKRKAEEAKEAKRWAID